MLQWFRLADSLEGVTHHRFHDVHQAQGDTPFCIDPVTQVLAKLDLKDRCSRVGHRLLRLFEAVLLPQVGG